jgi:hypothetical protein
MSRTGKAGLAAAASLLLLHAHTALAQQAPEQAQDAAVEAEPAMAPPPATAPSELPALMAPVPAPTPEQAPGQAQDAAAVIPPEPVSAVSAAPAGTPAATADEIADIFSKVGDQLYEDCIFELSDEQVQVQAALILSYMEKGASSVVARRLAATQIQPPKLSEQCEQMRRTPDEPAAPDWSTTTVEAPKKPAVVAAPKPVPEQPPPAITLAGKKMLARWDCAPGVDFVTVKLNGSERKLTGGEICSPFEDVVREVPASASSFRLGYTIATGRLFVISDDPSVNGTTIAWGLSGRDICRNNPDPDCFAAKAIGPLPPGEYTFSSAEPAKRVSWGPRTKRHVVAVYLKSLWNKDRFSAQHRAAIAKRGNIAIHVRLKGEMSEACIGLEPKGWAYVASLVKAGRATGLDVHIDEPHPQIAEAPPVIVASSFSLTSLFK